MTTESPAIPIPRASTILGALEAVRNIRAGVLTALVLVTSAIIFALFAYMSARGGGIVAGATGALLSLFISVYGISAVGFILMNDAKDAPPLSVVEALTISLVSTHRWIGVMLLAFLGFLVFAIVLMIILVVCKIPFVGPVLYTGVLPVATLTTAAFLAAMYFVVGPLAFPAVWMGDTTMQAVSRLWAIVRQRLVQVVVQVLLLLLLCFFTASIIGGLVFGGLAIVGGLSAAVLPGGGGIAGVGAMMGGLMAGAGREGGGYLIAGAIGGAIVGAIVMIVPFLILLRGYCLIYLEVIQGIDFAAAESGLQSTMENIQRKAREARARVAERTQSQPAAPVAAKPDMQHSRPTAAPAAAPAPVAPAPVATKPSAAQCPQCATTVIGDDAFCSNCGFKLR